MQPTQLTKVKRQPKRASYALPFIKAIIEECIIGHMAFMMDKQAHSIPLPFWVYADHLYCHCAIQSRLIQLAQSSQKVCISFSITDGYVLAKSAIKHSMNYRSAVVYGSFNLVENHDEMQQAFATFINIIQNDRWQQVRQPNKKELNATCMLKIPLTEAVAKSRTGPPHDLKSDLKRHVWSGEIPIYTNKGEPVPDEYSGPKD